MLCEGIVGGVYKIVKIDLETNVKRRFEILGLTHNSKVTVLNSKKSGTKIIKVRGTRFAVGSDFACNIYVEECLGRGDDDK